MDFGSGRTGITVTRDALTAMFAAATAARPHEACGLLLGQSTQITQAVLTRNIHPTPETHFEIDPQALIDAHRAARAGVGAGAGAGDALQVIGYFHSHPSGAPEPSATDCAMAAHDGRIWAIIAEGDVQFWRDDIAGFAALSFAAIES